MQFEQVGGEREFQSGLYLARSKTKNRDYFSTVAVKVKRADELKLLHNLRQAKDHAIHVHAEESTGQGPTPELRFFERHNREQYDTTHPSFYPYISELASEYTDIECYYHDSDHHGNRDGDEIFAIHSVLLINELWDDDTVVIVNSGESQTKMIHDRLSNKTVAMTNCVKADAYYPAALLADLLAHRLTEKRQADFEQYGPLQVRLIAPKVEEEDKWTKAASKKNGASSYQAKLLPTGRGDDRPSRVSMWYQGKVCPTSRIPPTTITDADRDEIQTYVDGHAPSDSLKDVFDSTFLEPGPYSE